MKCQSLFSGENKIFTPHRECCKGNGNTSNNQSTDSTSG